MDRETGTAKGPSGDAGDSGMQRSTMRFQRSLLPDLPVGTRNDGQIQEISDALATLTNGRLRAEIRKMPPIHPRSWSPRSRIVLSRHKKKGARARFSCKRKCRISSSYPTPGTMNAEDRQFVAYPNPGYAPRTVDKNASTVWASINTGASIRRAAVIEPSADETPRS